jgi:DNA-binding NarL/FixJ family response regulator
MVEGSRLHAGGLAALLTSRSAAIAVVSVMRELDECYCEIDRHRPDIAIFEVRRIRPEFVRFLRLLRERHGTVRLVVIVGSMERHGAQQLLSLGLGGLLSADLAPADLLAALHVIRSGGLVVDPTAMSHALNGSDQGSLALTAWELRILRLAAQGMRNDEMARQLSISQSTLKRNFRLIFGKLGARDRTSALVAAARAGLI